MNESERKELEKRFDEEFQEQFFPLHYRFCPLVDKEGQHFQERCSEQRKAVVDELKSFLFKEINDLLEKKRGEIEGMKVMEIEGYQGERNIILNGVLKILKPKE